MDNTHVVACGSGENGQLGIGNDKDANFPVDILNIRSLLGHKQVSFGSRQRGIGNDKDATVRMCCECFSMIVVFR